MGVVMTSTQAAGDSKHYLYDRYAGYYVRSDVFFNDPSAEKRTKTGHSHAE